MNQFQSSESSPPSGGQPPMSGEGGIPAWIWIVVIVVIVLFVGYVFFYTTGLRQESESIPPVSPTAPEFTEPVTEESVEPGSVEDVGVIENELNNLNLEGLDQELGDIEGELQGL